MSNITTTPHFQFPDCYFRLLPAIKPAGLKLLLLLLHESQRHSRNTITITTQEIRTATGISVNSVQDAREDLISLGVASCIPSSEKAGWIFTLLDPATGEERASRKDKGRITTWSVKEVLTYFGSHLETYRVQPNGADGVKARCPFHEGGKPSDRPLKACYAPNGGGYFRCFTCGKSGTILDFEIALAAKRKKEIDRKDAVQRAVKIMIRSMNKKPAAHTFCDDDDAVEIEV